VAPRAWLDAALDLVFPAICPVCATALAADRRPPLCGACWRTMPRLAPPWCARCGLAFPTFGPHARTMGGDCHACTVDPPAFTWARAAVDYDGPAREALQAFKFGGRRLLARPFAELILDTPEVVARLLRVDALVPVPLAPSRERERGFNQAAALAERLGARVGRPVRDAWLSRTRVTAPQTELSAVERRVNVRGAFAAASAVHGRTVALVDDVYTTGATVSECAQALRDAGAREVAVVTVARVA
jgi:ComF family protein